MRQLKAFTGTYIYCRPNGEAKAMLAAFVQRHFPFSSLNFRTFHCSIVQSPDNIRNSLIDLYSNPNRRFTAVIEKVTFLGDWLTLELESDDLTERYKFWTDKIGLSSKHPEFIPHISLVQIGEDELTDAMKEDIEKSLIGKEIELLDENVVDANPPKPKSDVTKETATADVSARAFINALALIAHPFIYDGNEMDESIFDYLAEAQPFVNNLKLKTTWQALSKAIINDASWDKIADLGFDLANLLRDRAPQIRSNMDLSKEDVDFINKWQLYFRTDSESAQKFIIQTVGKVCDGKVVAEYTTDTANNATHQRKAEREASKIIKRFTGESRPVMTMDECKSAKAKNPELYKEYLAIRRQVNMYTKDTIVNLTRGNGGPVDSSKLIGDLDKMGINHSIPKAFIGKLDETGYYTIFGEKINGTPVGDVMMNPQYTKGSSTYVLKTKAPGAKTWQMLYTVNAKSTSNAHKFDLVTKTIDSFDKAIGIWRRDLMSKSDWKEYGVMLEILYLSQARIGTAGNATEGKNTYGLSTIEARHVKVKGNTATITYIGKKGSKQKHVIEGTLDKYSKEVVKWLSARIKVLENTDQVFDLSARDVNHYIKTRLGLQITAHKFRTIRGTVLMDELLDAARTKLPKSPTDKQVTDAFNKAALRVGEILGHSNKSPDGGVKVTGQTAIKNYISPDVMGKFFADYSVRPPKVLEQLLSKGV